MSLLGDGGDLFPVRAVIVEAEELDLTGFGAIGHELLDRLDFHRVTGSKTSARVRLPLAARTIAAPVSFHPTARPYTATPSYDSPDYSGSISDN